MKKEILILVPESSITKEKIEEFSTKHPRILFKSVYSIYPEEEVKELLSKHEFKIVAGRGGSLDTLKKFFKDTNIIKLEVSLYDLLNVLSRIKSKYSIISLITVGLNISGLENLSKLLGIKFINHLLTSRDKLDNAIIDSIKEGADIIIGGTYTARRINTLNIKIENYILPIGEETLNFAINEGYQILHAIQSEERDRAYILRCLDELSEGLIFVKDGSIRLINAEAENLLGTSRNYLSGFSSEHLAPELLQWTQEEKSANEKILTLRGKHLLITRTEREGDKDSFILSMQSQDTLKDKEGQLRTKAYSSHNNAKHYRFSDISGTSASISETIYTAQSYARRDSSILISGESGCGKEVFAQSIHYESARSNRPFIAVNCASFTKDLVRSELFGYVEGAFTGALKQGKPGIFEIAHEGTIFLDEISEMDYSLQASLLRVLQEGYVVRMGSHKIIPVDVRIIAATNKDLEDLALRGEFRVDLYYRLNVLPLRIPPLRERKRDILPLLLYFLNQDIPTGHKKYSLEAKARNLLESYRWPGNIRELGNVAQRLLATCSSSKITEEELRGALLLPSSSTQIVLEEVASAREKKKLLQIEEIRQALDECGGNVCQAAKKLGMDRTTLWRRMKRFQEKK